MKIFETEMVGPNGADICVRMTIKEAMQLVSELAKQVGDIGDGGLFDFSDETSDVSRGRVRKFYFVVGEKCETERGGKK